MKKQTFNIFTEGLNTDLHPLSTPKTVLVDAMNVDFTTTSDNQLVLQKRVGNAKFKHDGAEVTLTPGYEPLAVASINDVAYIISYNTVEGLTELGTFPSPDYEKLFSDEDSTLILTYKSLHNFLKDGGDPSLDTSYTAPFRTSSFNFSLKSVVDIKLQVEYDASINIVFASKDGPIRLVNSRLIIDSVDNNIKLADRDPEKDSNTYSENDIHRTTLIPTYKGVPSLKFIGVSSNGVLAPGGYRYYFRYLTPEFLETDIIEESRVVEVHYGDTPDSAFIPLDGELTNRSVSFTLSDLDISFASIRVYYSLAVGNTQAINTAYRLESIYPIDKEKGTCDFTHTGYEEISEIDTEELGVVYSQIANSETMDVANNRLIVGNTDVASIASEEYRVMASSIKLTEKEFDVIYGTSGTGQSENYSNASFTYNQLGYWKGETYEVAVVYITDKGLTPAYPIQGIDSNDGAAYDDQYLGSTDPGFFNDDGQNARGIYRTNGKTPLDYIVGAGAEDILLRGLHFSTNITKLLGYPDTMIYENLTSLTVGYDTATQEYSVLGTLSTEIPELYTFGTLATIPHPAKEQFFYLGYSTAMIYIGVNGVASALRVIPEGTNFTSTDGPSQGNLDYKGFFFVRRPRRRDRMAQGLILPTAAIPIKSSSSARSSVGVTGTFCGVGVTSKDVGDNVTFVPVPHCTMPYAMTNVWSSYTKYLASGKWKEYPKHQGPHTLLPSDTIIKAPILDYSRIDAFAFYSPDVDTSPPLFASSFSGNIRSTAIYRDNPIKVRYTRTDPIESPPSMHAMVTDMKLWDRNKVDGEFFSSKFAGHYVEGGSFSPASKSFSASQDRNINLYMNTFANDTGSGRSGHRGKPDLSYFPTYSFIFSHDNPFKPTNDSDFYPVCTGLPSKESEDEQIERKEHSDYLDGRTLGLIVKYNRYIGMKIDGGATELPKLSFPIITYLGKHSEFNVNVEMPYLMSKNRGLGLPHEEQPDLRDDEYYESGTPSPDIASMKFHFSYLTDVFDNDTGAPIEHHAWRSKYSFDETTGYVAISKRYSVAEFNPTAHISALEVDLYGGDCYLGVQKKQIWLSAGIPEAPQVNDPEPYRYDRLDLGLAPHGLAINIPTQANSNFNVRSLERHSELEHGAFGRDRSYLPVVKEIRGQRLLETGLYSQGLSSESIALFKTFRLNTHFPYIRFDYSNRVYASEPGVSNQFLNGFASFKGLNFKDYNTELGQITKIITQGNYTFLVFDFGISLIGVDDRTMVTAETGGVYMDNVDILAKKSVVISDVFGSQHLHSIRNTNKYVYGVDVLNKRIWRFNKKGLELISDFRVKAKLTEIIEELSDYVTDQGWWFDIFTSYDAVKDDLFFTFVVRNPLAPEMTPISRTLVFSESLNIWITETDDTRKFFFKTGRLRLSFSSQKDLTIVYEYDLDLEDQKPNYNIFYGDIVPAEISLVVLDSPGVSKLFENQLIVGNNTTPTSVDYVTDRLHDVHTQIVKPMSNVTYSLTSRTVSGTAGETSLFLSAGAPIIKANGESLTRGDIITVTEGSSVSFYIIMNYNDTTSTILIDTPLQADVTSGTLRIGYSGSFRTANAIYESHMTKLILSNNNKTTSKEYYSQGKWMKQKFTYNGMHPMYINSILTLYTQQYS